MKYYKTWQEAFLEFVTRFGSDYEDSYTLSTDFEERLGKNIKGVWYIYFGEDK